MKGSKKISKEELINKLKNSKKKVIVGSVGVLTVPLLFGFSFAFSKGKIQKGKYIEQSINIVLAKENVKNTVLEEKKVKEKQEKLRLEKEQRKAKEQIRLEQEKEEAEKEAERLAKEEEEKNKEKNEENNESDQNNGNTEENKQVNTPSYAYVDLNVPYINQYDAGAPMGCEAASLLEAFHYKGYATNYDLKSFLSEIPISPDDNPYHGFVRSPWIISNEEIFQSIFPDALISWGSKYGNVKNISGQGIEGLRRELLNGNPVVIYTIYQFGYPQWQNWFFGRVYNNMHVMTACGYNQANGQYKVADPAGGTYWVDGYTFERCYNYLGWGVAVH